MCGRYTSTTPASRLAETFHVDEVRVEELPIRYNVAPTQPVYAVAESSGPVGQRLLGALRWGLVPPWAADPGVGARMINARAEGIDRRSAFREALARRRCIIPADAFYEWERPAAGRPRPWAFARADGRPMAFAGLWESWRGAGASRPGEALRTCTIVTAAANEVVAPVHPRMPVILSPDAWDAWLDPSARDVTAAMALLVPPPADGLRAWTVSSLVNHAANEGPELLEPETGRRSEPDRLPGLDDGGIAEAG
jgi:putative SOS response-associated peptidase YedK